MTPHASLLTLLVGSPDKAAELCEDPRHAPRLSLVALGVLLVGCGAFGALLGFTRSPLQAFYLAVKLPLAWLLTLSVCVPAYYAVAAALGRPLALRTICAGVLVATGRAAAILLGLLPLLWFAQCLASHSDVDYHRIIGLAVVLYAGSGLAALGMMGRVLGGGKAALVAAAALFLLVGGQACWTLRPFVGRPADAEVPFLRPAEDTFLAVLPRALRSASGDYDRVAPHDSRRGGDL